MVAQSIYTLAFAKQTAKGAAATAAAFRVPVVGGDVMPQRTVNDLEETGANRQRSQSYVSRVDAGGAPEFAVRLKPLGLLAYGALGAKAVVGAAAPYTHTITAANALPWFTVWRMLGDLIYDKFIDCKVTQLVLTSEAGQPVRAAVTFMGLDHESLDLSTFTTEVAVAEDNGPPLMHYDGAGAFLLEGAAVSSIERIVVTINNNGSLQQGDSLAGYDVSEGMRNIQIETRQAIIDAAAYNRFHYGSATPAAGTGPNPEVVELAGPNGIDFLWTQVGAAPGPEESLRVQAQRLQIVSLGGYSPGTGNDPLKQDATYRAYQPASGSPLTAVLKNAQATY